MKHLWFIRVFVWLAGGLLLASGLTHLLNAAGSAQILMLPDPVLGVPLRYGLLAAGALELTVALICLFGKRPSFQLLWLAWLGANLLVYRFGLRSFDCSLRCTCLGYPTDPLHLSPATARLFLNVTAFYVLLGSCAALLWQWRHPSKTPSLQPSTTPSLQPSTTPFFKMSCPACGLHIEFAAQDLGQNISCPECKADITLQKPARRARLMNLGKGLRPQVKRRLKLALAGVCVLLLVPAVQVGCVALVRPPTTLPMGLRRLEGALRRGVQAPNRYQWVPLREVPRPFLTSVWVAEDRQFFNHRGFDWQQIQRARAAAKASGRPPRGASTITQQCARGLFLWEGRSWVRKGLEAYYTVWMELLLSKRRILELYVNVSEFGEGVYGVEAGAQRHYGVHARDLTPEQAAMLTAILPRPKDWDPNHPSEDVLKRKTTILGRAAHARLPLEPLP